MPVAYRRAASPIAPEPSTGSIGKSVQSLRCRSETQVKEAGMAQGAANFGDEEQAMQAYFRDGEQRAGALSNRGPIRLTAEGKLSPEILAAYLETGFYVFEGVLRPEELRELQADFLDIVEQLPATPDAPVSLSGHPALGADLPGGAVRWAKPLGDPFGGTGKVGGRAPVKMAEPTPDAAVPAEVPYLVLGPLQFSDAALRMYGHPGLLAIAAAVNGDDFAPFNEVFIIKKPGEGSAFAWHQDGTTHWDHPEWTPVIHGFNFMVQLYGCTAANGLWYIPGSHRWGKVDIAALVEQAGSNRLPDAVPLVCNPGDVAICNRQTVHASFPNTSDDMRVTLNMGFHRRASLIGVEARGMSGTTQRYDEDRVRQRSEVLGYAIDARRQRFPEEHPFSYRPHADAGATFHWSDDSRAQIRNSHLRDMLI